MVHSEYVDACGSINMDLPQARTPCPRGMYSVRLGLPPILRRIPTACPLSRLPNATTHLHLLRQSASIPHSRAVPRFRSLLFLRIRLRRSSADLGSHSCHRAAATRCRLASTSRLHRPCPVSSGHEGDGAVDADVCLRRQMRDCEECMGLRECALFR